MKLIKKQVFYYIIDALIFIFPIFQFHWINSQSFWNWQCCLPIGLTPGKSKTNWSVIRHRFNFERRKVEAGNKTFWPHYTPLLFLIATRQVKQYVLNTCYCLNNSNFLSFYIWRLVSLNNACNNLKLLSLFPHLICRNSSPITPKTVTSKVGARKVAVLKAAVSKEAIPKVATPKVTVLDMFEPKKKVESQSPSNAASNSASNHQQMLSETHQLVPAAIKRGRTTRSNKEPLYAVPLPPISMDESNKQELSFSSSDSDVSVVEEINMNGSIIRRHIENPVSYKRVCIRQMQETQLQNLDDDDDDDEIRRFCSYLEVMLRKMPKPHQEMFCEETLDHLASVNRKLRRSNF